MIPKRLFEINWPLILKISSKKVRKTQNWLHPLICETLDRPSVYLHKDIVKENKHNGKTLKQIYFIFQNIKWFINSWLIVIASKGCMISEWGIFPKNFSDSTITCFIAKCIRQLLCLDLYDLTFKAHCCTFYQAFTLSRKPTTSHLKSL